MAIDNVHIYLSEILFLGNRLPRVRDGGEFSVSWSGWSYFGFLESGTQHTELLYALGKHQLKFPLKVLKIEMLEEQAAQDCSVKAIFLEPLESEKKVPKLSFSPAKACALHHFSYGAAAVGNTPPPPCLASTNKTEHNSQIAK